MFFISIYLSKAAMAIRKYPFGFLIYSALRPLHSIYRTNVYGTHSPFSLSLSLSVSFCHFFIPFHIRNIINLHWEQKYYDSWRYIAAFRILFLSGVRHSFILKEFSHVIFGLAGAFHAFIPDEHFISIYSMELNESIAAAAAAAIWCIPQNSQKPLTHG